MRVTVTNLRTRESRALDLQKDTVVVGRDETADVALPSPAKMVSRRHAVLSRAPKGFFVENHGANGTFVNGTPVEGKVFLHYGVELAIESWLLRVDADGAPAAPPPARARQPEEVIRLKKSLHAQLLESMDLRRLDFGKTRDEVLRADVRGRLERLVGARAAEIPPALNRELLIKEILDEALGLGPLEDLLDDAVLACIERIVTPLGRRIDESSPLVDARLKDGSRVNCIIPPLAIDGPCITIRKFSKIPLTVDDLIRFGTLNRRMAKFLERCVIGRKNVIISGGTGSGKTTLLNVLAGYIPRDDRIVTIEDAAELRLPQEHVVRLETKPPNIEGKGAFTIRDLVRNSLRMRPDRIVVGECRGGESLDMLQAMNTGHDGSLTTGHANSPQDMIARLETMVLMAGMDLPVRAIREQIAGAINVVVQQTRFSDGSRRVTHISEVTGIDKDTGGVMVEEIFAFQRKGIGPGGEVLGEVVTTGYIPTFIAEFKERGLVQGTDYF